MRTAHRYTQADVSSLLGVNQSLISKYEPRERQVSVDTLEKLVDLYCCDLVHLPPVVSPAIQAAFRANNIDASNMKAIQAISHVVLNGAFMEDLLRERLVDGRV